MWHGLAELSHRRTDHGITVMKHADVWRGLDRLAADNGLSPSGLARRAGLDPTTFNPSKRTTPAGRPRWPSTESLSKALDAVRCPLARFVALMDEDGSGGGLQRVPLIGMAQAGDAGYFDDAGYPVGGGWDEIVFPETLTPHAYALEVNGQSMEPAYRDGDRLIVAPAAPVRRGDRVVVRSRLGEVMVKELVRQTATRIELKSLNPLHADRQLGSDEVDWVARVVWVSQ